MKYEIVVSLIPEQQAEKLMDEFLSTIVIVPEKFVDKKKGIVFKIKNNIVMAYSSFLRNNKFLFKAKLTNSADNRRRKK